MRNRKTTKLLALALSLLMLFTMIPISVSAGDEPQTILDVAQHDENGNYWLEADVTVNATYAGEFTGTFDGKGFTVNTTAPLFKTVNGATIENLTVEGTVAGYAAVASLVTGDKTTFKNVTNNNSVINADYLSLEKRVTKFSSPAFIWHTVNDDVVPVIGSITMAQKYNEYKIPFELHLFEKGQHGLSVATKEVNSVNENVAEWLRLSVNWLKTRGFIIYS